MLLNDTYRPRDIHHIAVTWLFIKNFFLGNVITLSYQSVKNFIFCKPVCQWPCSVACLFFPVLMKKLVELLLQFLLMHFFLHVFRFLLKTTRRFSSSLILHIKIFFLLVQIVTEREAFSNDVRLLGNWCDWCSSLKISCQYAFLDFQENVVFW